jgi:hypothetical protein
MARFLYRILVLCLMVAFLTAPLATAEPRDEHGAVSPQVLGQLWSWMSDLWAEAGCIVGPSGRCRETSSPVYQEEGCMIDPSGRCGTPRQSNLEAGCILDPNGGCRH